MYHMLLDRFLEYVKIDTQSDDFSESTPTTEKQFNLLKLLKKQLDELKVTNELTETGRLYGFIPGDPSLEAIGLNAHVDTAPDFSGKDVNPCVVKNYDGKVKILGNSGRFLDPEEYPILKELVGKTLITTDGNTLLGADDKAGVAIIMEVVEAILKLPVSQRRPMYILFTPDEEVGRGAEELDRSKFKAKFAYTFDGSEPDIINIETFNAKSAEVKFTGKAIHPGDAKGIMINASKLAIEFVEYLPEDECPEKTSDYEGFFHLTDMKGCVDSSTLSFILRDHNKAKLAKQVELFENAAEKVRKNNPNAKVELTIKNQYSNMFEIIKEQPECKNFIEAIFKKLGMTPKYKPIRGGTDGATFSFKGCPTPNLGTGSYNHHGPYEFAVLEEMQQLVKVGIEIFKK